MWQHIYYTSSNIFTTRPFESNIFASPTLTVYPLLSLTAATPGGCCVVTSCRIHICSFSSSPIVTLAGVWCLGGGWLELPCYRPSVARSCCLHHPPPAGQGPRNLAPGPAPVTWTLPRLVTRVTRGAGCHEDVKRM